LEIGFLAIDQTEYRCDGPSRAHRKAQVVALSDAHHLRASSLGCVQIGPNALLSEGDEFRSMAPELGKESALLV